MRKFKHACVLAVLAAVIAACGCTSGESYTAPGFNFANLNKVAIVEVDSPLGSRAAENQIADFFAMELLKKGYTPIERQQVDAILKEQEFQAGSLTSNEEAARAGRILNVPAVMIVNIPTWGERIDMTAKLVKVEDGSILWLGTGSGGTRKTLSTVVGAAIGAGAGAAVGGGDSSDRAVGAVVGGVAGGLAGHALSPSEAKASQNLVRKIMESLPPRVSSI